MDFVEPVSPKGLRRMRNLIRCVALFLSFIFIAGGSYKLIVYGDKIGGGTDITAGLVLTLATFYFLLKKKPQELYKFSFFVLVGGCCFLLFTLTPALLNIKQASVWETIVKVLYGFLIAFKAGAYFFSVYRYKKALLHEYQRQPSEEEETAGFMLEPS